MVVTNVICYNVHENWLKNKGRCKKTPTNLLKMALTITQKGNIQTLRSKCCLIHMHTIRSIQRTWDYRISAALKKLARKFVVVVNLQGTPPQVKSFGKFWRTCKCILSHIFSPFWCSRALLFKRSLQSTIYVFAISITLTRCFQVIVEQWWEFQWLRRITYNHNHTYLAKYLNTSGSDGIWPFIWRSLRPFRQLKERIRITNLK